MRLFDRSASSIVESQMFNVGLIGGLGSGTAGIAGVSWIFGISLNIVVMSDWIWWTFLPTLSHCFLTSAWCFSNSRDGLLGFGFLNPARLRHCIILCLQQYSINAINVRITKKIESSITKDMLVFGFNAFSMSCSSVSSGSTVGSGLTKIVVLKEFTSSCAGENNNKQKQHFSNFFKDFICGFFNKCLCKSWWKWKPKASKKRNI